MLRVRRTEDVKNKGAFGSFLPFDHPIFISRQDHPIFTSRAEVLWRNCFKLRLPSMTCLGYGTD